MDEAGRCRYGFEVKFYHLIRAEIDLETFLDASETLGATHFVVLKRRNMLRKIVSSMAAKQRVGSVTRREAFHLEQGTSPSLTPLYLDPDEVGIDTQVKPLLRFLEAFDADFARLERLLEERRALFLTYEEHIRTDPTHAYRRICSFIGVRPAKVKVRYSRTNPFPLSSLILNYADVVDALRGTPYAWMVEAE